MAYFESTEQLRSVLGGFFTSMASHAEISPKLLASQLVIRFNYDEPRLSITVDCSGDAIAVLIDDSTRRPEVEMTMKADIAHRFWLGKLNLLTALTRKQIVAKGPIPKVLKLLPVIKPAYALYPQYLEESGYQQLLVL